MIAIVVDDSGSEIHDEETEQESKVPHLLFVKKKFFERENKR